MEGGAEIVSFVTAKTSPRIPRSGGGGGGGM